MFVAPKNWFSCLSFPRRRESSGFGLDENIDSRFCGNDKRRSFTLIELLVVLALVAILSVVVILALNPAELIKQARDSNRLSDLSTINTALNLFSADVTGGFMGTSTKVYVSIPSTLSDCSNLGLPTLPSGYTYNCVTATSTRNTDGTGWIPVNFQRISSNSPISQLPIDPINATSTGNYYIYVCGGSWELASNVESAKQKSVTGSSGTDGGLSLSSYEAGNNLRLIPAGLLEWKRDPSLVGYWTFDENTGSAAKDYSGYGNNGTLTNSSSWVSGKLMSGLYFGPTGGVAFSAPDSSSLDITDALTISFWLKATAAPAASTQHYFFSKWGGISDANFAWLWYSSGHTTSPNQMGMLANRGGVWGVMHLTYNTVAPDTDWKNFSITYEKSGSSKLYINGMLSRQAAGAGVLATNSSAFTINSGANYEATLDDFRIYNRAFSAAEVSALYDGTR